MRTATNDGIKFTYPDEGVWSAERQIIYLERVSGSVSEVTLSKRKQGVVPWVNEDIATYKLDANGKCAIDITDLVRTFGVYQSAIDGNTSLYLTLTTSGGTLSFYLRLAGIINPAGVYIPAFTMPDALVVPPERILYAGLCDIKSELYPTDLHGTWELTNGLWVDSSTKRQILAINDFSLTRKRQITPLATRVSKFYYIGNTGSGTSCDTPAVAVRWVSFTGVERVHHFLLRKPTIATDISYQLLTLDNSYDEIKGRVDSFDLYIDELLPYDLWYYADIITSSKVEVSLDGQNWRRAQVTTKNVTVPTGEMSNGKLEITVNWRKYDAVTM